MLTQKMICNELLKLMEKKPYYKIKVTELVENLGIHRQTFYLHFDSVPDALDQIENEFISGLYDEYEIRPLQGRYDTAAPPWDCMLK